FLGHGRNFTCSGETCLARVPLCVGRTRATKVSPLQRIRPPRIILVMRYLPILIVLLLAHLVSANPKDYSEIQVLDDQTTRPVPLVELRTTNAIAYYTDSAGRVAFNEPGIMDKDI